MNRNYIEKSKAILEDIKQAKSIDLTDSNRMEKMVFEKTLKSLKDEGIIPEQITTDRHVHIRTYLKEEEPSITHQFDVWHFAKNIKKKLLVASKKSACKILEKWIKPIGNHFWWSCTICDGNVQMLRER